MRRIRMEKEKKIFTSMLTEPPLQFIRPGNFFSGARPKISLQAMLYGIIIKSNPESRDRMHVAASRERGSLLTVFHEDGGKRRNRRIKRVRTADHPAGASDVFADTMISRITRGHDGHE